MEKRTEVKVIQVSLKCDECEIGEMIYTGRESIHQCNACGNQFDVIGKTYPFVEYEPK